MKHVVVALLMLAGCKKPEPSFAALDAIYATRKEPIPPGACRRAEETEALAKGVYDQKALANRSPEASFMIAHAVFDATSARAPELEAALACPGFAAARSLAGKAAIASKDLEAAKKYFDEAKAIAPTWLDNRASLAGVLLQLKEQDAAKKEIDAIIAADANYAPGHLLKFSALWLDGDTYNARVALCAAYRLGSAQAASKLDALQLNCDQP
jgi:tetratricopeptide (TPR) repeat protein